MPKATADVMSTSKHDLKSLPPDGFVELRRMTYGQSLERREMLKMTMAASDDKDGSFVGEMAMASAKITQAEFAWCVVDHNCEADDGRKLDFNNLVDFKSLDPRVGSEIEKLISDMNNFKEIEGN